MWFPAFSWVASSLVFSGWIPLNPLKVKLYLGGDLRTALISAGPRRGTTHVGSHPRHSHRSRASANIDATMVLYVRWCVLVHVVIVLSAPFGPG